MTKNEGFHPFYHWTSETIFIYVDKRKLNHETLLNKSQTRVSKVKDLVKVIH